MDTISIRGARTNNLKNIDVDIPKNKLVVITGLSGSGKSSLAFDTLYAEGQRRYCESVSAYARQFMNIEDKPDIDSVSGITPTIAISQGTSRIGSRSTVGTVSEISDYLRLLFARSGVPYCPRHDEPLTRFGIHDMVDAALELKEGTKIAILAPMKPIDSSEAHVFLKNILKQGFVRARFHDVMDTIEVLLTRSYVGTVRFDIVVDRLKVSDLSRTRIADSLETAVKLSEGFASILDIDANTEKKFNTNYGCPTCGYTMGELVPAMFSFNNSLGACPTCSGLGIAEQFDELLMIRDPTLSLRDGAIYGWSIKNHVHFEKLKQLSEVLGFSLDVSFNRLDKNVRQAIFNGYGDFVGVLPELQDHWDHAKRESSKIGMQIFRSMKTCSECGGSRYREEVRNVFIGKKKNRINIAQFTSWTLSELERRLRKLTFDKKEGEIARGLVREIRRRLGFLCDVGLGYLRLDREVKTLSGGEMQRLRLAGQIGSGLTGVTYVLDEPTVGLHPSDTASLISTLRALVKIGNTVVVVEHDESVIRAADWIIDIGPAAGELGGKILAMGTLKDLLKNPDSVTGRSLLKKKKIVQSSVESSYDRFITISGARGHNLKDVTCRFPIGAMTVVTGVSGSGKSSLLLDTLTAWLRRTNYRSYNSVLPFETISGTDAIDKLVIVDQSPIGRTPKSNPATYAGFFTAIRNVFSETISARERGYGPGRFSFNSPGGRCEACAGDGQMKFEMNFLPAVYVTCPVCHGKRYNRETLEVKFKGKSIADVLEMTVDEASELFQHPGISQHLQSLRDVGLGYIRLGQSATTLSGGEAQRVKLAEELAKTSTGNTLYVLDEPTTGLHFEDVEILMQVLKLLRARGNTILMIEHNPDVIRACDWIVELGPGGGDAGGCLLAEGPVASVFDNPKSIIRAYL